MGRHPEKESRPISRGGTKQERGYGNAAYTTRKPGKRSSGGGQISLVDSLSWPGTWAK